MLFLKLPRPGNICKGLARRQQGFPQSASPGLGAAPQCAAHLCTLTTAAGAAASSPFSGRGPSTMSWVAHVVRRACGRSGVSFRARVAAQELVFARMPSLTPRPSFFITIKARRGLGPKCSESCMIYKHFSFGPISTGSERLREKRDAACATLQESLTFYRCRWASNQAGSERVRAGSERVRNAPKCVRFTSISRSDPSRQGPTVYEINLQVLVGLAPSSDQVRTG